MKSMRRYFCCRTCSAQPSRSLLPIGRGGSSFTKEASRLRSVSHGPAVVVRVDGETLGQNYFELPAGVSRTIPLYRLDPIPEPADRAVELEAPPIEGESDAEHLARSEDWTNDHYSMCRDVFQSIWEFLCREYSSTDGFLGPIENIDVKVGGRKGQNTPQFRSAQRADQATSAPPMGSVEGRTIHPDYPDGSARGPHDNHFHFQFGNSKVDTAKGDYER